MKVSAFLPCRKGSQRVPKKNIKPFAGYDFGLIEIKLKQLLAVESLAEIVLSTNDEEILAYASRFQHPKLRLHKRKDELASSSTSTDELVAHAAELIRNEHILWTHVTSPFVTTGAYQSIIEKYGEALDEGYDSLMTSSLIHGFLWDGVKPINYDRTVEKWPRTQTLKPVHEINSAVFLNSRDSYRTLNDRIGQQPYLYVLDKIQGFDVDWQEDFDIAEAIVKAGIVKL
jgi:CMP-N-acetylneuraminic acid synthetase